MKHTALTIALLGVMSASAVQAQTTAQATTALNLRAGPGPTAEILTVIPAAGDVSVDACLDADKWCQVTYDGTSGWAYGDYLTVTPEGASDPVVLYDNREKVTVRTVTREDAGGEAALTGGTIGAIAGALIGGPVGAAIGGVAGATLAADAAPDAQVTTYVRSNPVEQVYLDGEVVVGAGLPETVDLRAVPDTRYVYAYVNGVPVLVDPDSRQIVYILR
jgi:uncharacterized protein YraI